MYISSNYEHNESMIKTDFNTILDLLSAFPDEQSCIARLESLRWESGQIVSPFDSSSKVYKCANNRYRCKNTSKYFNVKTATLFDNTKVKLQKWFLAIWLVTSHKKGISSIQLSKDIGVTQKTAWFMLQRIRNCFGFDNDNDLSNEVEVDETYVGGKNKNKHNHNKVKGSQGRSVKDKAPVFGMVERGADQYVEGRIHTNTIEGFWSLLKRGIVGIYHFTSVKHLQKYVDEFVFRFNLLLANTGYRLRYEDLINA